MTTIDELMGSVNDAAKTVSKFLKEVMNVFADSEPEEVKGAYKYTTDEFVQLLNQKSGGETLAVIKMKKERAVQMIFLKMVMIGKYGR